MKLGNKNKKGLHYPALALLITLEALPGQEEAVEALLQAAPAGLLDEPDTVCWYAVKLSPAVYGVFASFYTEAAKAVHLAGKVVASLMEQSPHLFITAPHIQQLDIVSAKLPDPGSLAS